MMLDRNRMRGAAALYLAAWNETDGPTRERILEQCWAAEGVYVDPIVEIRGGKALSAHISQIQEKRPGARLEFASDIDCHHNVLRFLWRLVLADGSKGDISVDFAEVAADGRLAKVAGFFGPPPTLEADFRARGSE